MAIPSETLTYNWNWTPVQLHTWRMAKHSERLTYDWNWTPVHSQHHQTMQPNWTHEHTWTPQHLESTKHWHAATEHHLKPLNNFTKPHIPVEPPKCKGWPHEMTDLTMTELTNWNLRSTTWLNDNGPPSGVWSSPQWFNSSSVLG